MVACSGPHCYVVTFGAGAPTNLMAKQNGIYSVLVSWTPPSPPPSMDYQIKINSTNFSAATSSATSLTISLQPGVHNICLMALSQHYPSDESVEVTVKGNYLQTCTLSL